MRDVFFLVLLSEQYTAKPNVPKNKFTPNGIKINSGRKTRKNTKMNNNIFFVIWRILFIIYIYKSIPITKIVTVSDIMYE